MVTQSFDFQDRETDRRNVQCKRADGCRSRSIRRSNRLSISTNHDVATTAPRTFAWTKSRDVLNLATAMTAQQLGHVNDPRYNDRFNSFLNTSRDKASTTSGPTQRSKTPVSRHSSLLSAAHEGKRTALRIREYGSGLSAYLFCCMPSSANTIRNAYSPKRVASHNKTWQRVESILDHFQFF